jgi:hypothetical protein
MASPCLFLDLEKKKRKEKEKEKIFVSSLFAPLVSFICFKLFCLLLRKSLEARKKCLNVIKSEQQIEKD